MGESHVLDVLLLFFRHEARLVLPEEAVTCLEARELVSLREKGGFRRFVYGRKKSIKVKIGKSRSERRDVN